MNIRDAIVNAGGRLEGEYFISLKNPGTVATGYVNMDPVFTYPDLLDRIGTNLVEPVEWRFDALAGPAIGGIPLVYTTLRSARNRSKLRTVWADKQSDGSFTLKRMGFIEAVRGKDVLVLEDVTTTGSSSKAVGDCILAAGGNVIAYSCVWNRGNVNEEKMGAPFFSLIDEPIPAYKVGEHPKWGEWPLVEDLGHPKHFPDYPGPRIRLLAA